MKYNLTEKTLNGKTQTILRENGKVIYQGRKSSDTELFKVLINIINKLDNDIEEFSAAYAAGFSEG